MIIRVPEDKVTSIVLASNDSARPLDAWLLGAPYQVPGPKQR